MCCYMNKSSTTRLRNRMKANGGKMVFWRIYRCNLQTGKLYPRFYHTATAISPGLIVSNRKHCEPGADRLDSPRGPYDAGCPTMVNRGIHVYRSQKRAECRCPGRGYCVVPVMCRMEDLVTVGAPNSPTRTASEAVFMKVRLYAKDYHKAIREAKKRAAS